jgi:hypothetical protein
LGDKWVGRVRCTTQLRRDLQWWARVPSQANGRSIHRHVETAYIQCDSSCYGWGAVLKGKLEARDFWGRHDENQHITWQDQKVARLTVLNILPHLAARNILFHKDNHAMCCILACPTSRSHEMMEELRRLWFVLVGNNIYIMPRYIKSAANTWAKKLNRHCDYDNWQRKLTRPVVRGGRCITPLRRRLARREQLVQPLLVSY